MSYAVLFDHIVKLARGDSQSACSVFLYPSAEFEGFQEQVFLACFEVFQRFEEDSALCEKPEKEMLSSVIRSLSSSRTALSIALESSRTFPGQ